MEEPLPSLRLLSWFDVIKSNLQSLFLWHCLFETEANKHSCGRHHRIIFLDNTYRKVIKPVGESLRRNKLFTQSQVSLPSYLSTTERNMKSWRKLSEEALTKRSRLTSSEIRYTGLVFLQYYALGEEKSHYFYGIIAKIAQPQPNHQIRNTKKKTQIETHLQN